MERMNNNKTIHAYAPASIGNVSCGFDVMGMAVNAPGDEVLLSLNDSGTVTIEDIQGDNGKLPRNAAENTAGVAVIEFLKAIDSKHGAKITLIKNLPLGSGMGSSAASAVAAVVAVNHALGEPFLKADLLPFVMQAEFVACGSAHADNAAPSLLGGLILIRDNHPLDIIEIPTRASIPWYPFLPLRPVHGEPGTTRHEPQRGRLRNVCKRQALGRKAHMRCSDVGHRAQIGTYAIVGRGALIVAVREGAPVCARRRIRNGGTEAPRKLRQ